MMYNLLWVWRSLAFVFEDVARFVDLALTLGCKSNFSVNRYDNLFQVECHSIKEFITISGPKR